MRLGIDHCELCGEAGEEINALTVHHCDGDRENNHRSNLMVVHRWRCHTFADAVTQCYMARGGRCTWLAIKKAYKKAYHLF
jgi:hypothetical protein